MSQSKPSLWQIFTATFTLSAFTFGGGYVIVTLMKERFVDRFHWIEEDEMLDLVALSQSAPGAMAINASIIVGYKLRGLLGALTATIGTVLPPFLIITIISAFYNAFAHNFVISKLLEGMQAGVGAVICSVVYDMAAGITKSGSTFNISIMVIAFIATCLFKISVVKVVLVCIALGILKSVVLRKQVTR